MHARASQGCRDQRRRAAAMLVAVLVVTAGTGAGAAGDPINLEARGAATPAARPQASVTELSRSLEEVVARVLPSVVQVVTSGYAPLQPGGQGGNLLNPVRGGGSGVIIDTDGYVITNAHVVAGARRVQVRLPVPDGQPGGDSILQPSGELVGATIVGIDAETDLAVLKVAQTGLPAVELGDSDEVRTGSVVLAFGSPFGLENSVSMGVVSAPARQLESESPMIYVQTDAPINPGNSGGPLVDASGRVIGINTLIFSRSGGNEGIGFAAPSNIVRFVYEQIREHFRVQRGVVGIGVQTLSPGLARSLGLPRTQGVLVNDVYPGSPAAQAGVQIGDIILALDDKPMENARQFEVNVYRKEIGDQVGLEIVRGADTIRRRVTVVPRPNEAQQFIDLTSPERNLVEPLGLLCITVDARVAAALGGTRRPTGALVVATSGAAGPAEAFLPGDIIYMVNRTGIGSLEELEAAVDALRPLDPVAVQIERAGRLQFIFFEME